MPIGKAPTRTVRLREAFGCDLPEPCLRASLRIDGARLRVPRLDLDNQSLVTTGQDSVTDFTLSRALALDGWVVNEVSDPERSG